jgi:hypothetical protein
MQRRIILGAMVLATVFAQTSPSVAAGAIAIGRSTDVAKRGISMGFLTNRDTIDAAKERSMILCQDSGTTIAIDPQVETPGFGWAVADSQPAAETRALSNCRMTAGPTRQDARKVTDSYCDGTPKSNSTK